MGHRSFANFVVHLNLASSPDVVNSFMLEFNKIVRPKADMVTSSRFSDNSQKSKNEKTIEKIRNFKSQRCDQRYEDLEPWDETYFTGIMKSYVYNLDSMVISYYFPLSQCIKGLKVLVKSLFGAKFHSIPLVPSESWHEDVLKMSLHHPEEIVSLVCNISAPFDSSTARLKNWEDYQHFLETRLTFGLAETPSNLFEYYAWDYWFLRIFAKHYLTSNIILKEVVESMKGARNLWLKVICSHDYPGFVVNRIMMPMINEAFLIMYTGVAAKEDIDVGMKIGTNQPMGPLELANFIGLDVYLSIMKVLHTDLEDN
ncbi:hypothetical protein GIB67_029176 [Kingdonia uniflora]|uniref:Uncharacterized protein n=1 Tax=Kingdonia uniflora TaxID=39325 RepID=A0A7J7LS33_9MAGN|nr:hypothetical protein GIB67_029176 [Kingdonia uniflora]